MGIYDRSYYRDSAPSDGSWGIEGLTPIVKYLILANIAVFLLQIFFVREVRVSPLEMLRKADPRIDKLLTEYEKKSPEEQAAMRKKYPELNALLAEGEMDPLFAPTEKVSIFQEWFELDTPKVLERGQVWRLLTHAFCHDRHAIFHILFNMFFLYWFGCTLESMYGSREFLLFYLTAAVVAGLAFVGLDVYTGSSVPGIGASGAVMAVMMLYTMHFPYETFRVFWLFRLEMRWLMALYVIWDLHPILLALAGDRMFTGIAHAAHLGGCAFGFLYAKYQWRLEPLLDRLPWQRWSGRRRPRLRLVSAPLPDLPSENDDSRLDQLLQKISESGPESLTEEERVLLQNESRRMRERRNRDG
jgi:membrane associated rhomboid family serine protease